MAGFARGLSGQLLVCGTGSDAGKSALVAGLCRVLARQGISVAPFKAQNMSNNSVVTVDGGEIGRAQAVQALAAGLEPHTRFNPVLLKPSSDRRSDVLVRGHSVGSVGAADYRQFRERLRAVVEEEFRSLAAEFDVVIAEGAGSPAEINLRANDISNLGLAAAVDIPAIVVGDIDRGGVLAHLAGTLAVLDRADQDRIRGFVINKFRGDPDLLAPGLEQLRELTGRPTLGVVPFDPALRLDAEDSLAARITARPAAFANPRSAETVAVAVIALPRVSNTTDIDALLCEPAVTLWWTADPDDVRDADLVVLPGTKTTVADLEWLRGRGLDRVLVERAAAGRATLAICGGYQLAGRLIEDPDGVESSTPHTVGLGIFDHTTVFGGSKTVRQVAGRLAATEGDAAAAVHGYEIHFGQIAPDLAHQSARSAPLLSTKAGPEGVRAGAVWGTHWHGLLGNDAARRQLLDLAAVRPAAAHAWRGAERIEFARARAAAWDGFADLLEEQLDLAALRTIIERRDRPLPSLQLTRG